MEYCEDEGIGCDYLFGVVEDPCDGSVDTGEGMNREGVDECSKDVDDKIDPSVRYFPILGHE